MPRTLPWLVGQNDTGRVKQESTPRKRIKAEPAPDHDQTPKNPPSSPDKRNFLRSCRVNQGIFTHRELIPFSSAAQTPPTSPIKRCPSEEFLIEGLDKDDAWIMVEDEFYAVAQTFTQHLHYAEYVRRTKEAKARNAASLGELDRPTDGRTAIPKNVQRKHEAEKLAARQKSGLGQVLGGNAEEHEDTEDEMWAGTHLHDLLTSPRKARSLAGVQTIKSATRAAAGYGKAAAFTSSQARVTSGEEPPSSSMAPEVQRMDVDEETASDEDDDLDLEVTTAPAPVRRQPGNQSGPVPSSGSTDKPRSAERPTASSSKSKRQSFARPSQGPAVNVPKSRMQMLFDDLDELPAPSRQRASVSDRKGEHIPSEGVPVGTNNPKAKKTRYNEVPTFLV
ncbi:hypothetical protein N7510_007639 [Penicillium lagena]|uniref:uncharacterized protein n=1 Tax=Penicillium lagena TaxID=94218 RepID=UPI00254070BB|nr:uncharacterized protein N7510_007639 [Penicillium lagena]KAJ5610920.1 hypothetical protein N7510_007639 [Penicillium lagena]